MAEISKEDQTALGSLRAIWAEWYTVRFDGTTWSARRHDARPWSRSLTARSWTDLRELLREDWNVRTRMQRRRRG